MTLIAQLERTPVPAPEQETRRSAPFVHPHSTAPALVSESGILTHAELARRVTDLADQLPPVATGRRLVHLPPVSYTHLTLPTIYSV